MSAARRGKRTVETVWDWDVEGEDYVFYSPVPEPGWYVLRCDQGKESEPVRFKVPPFEYEEDHPLQEMPAIEHFNNTRACKGHDTTKTYTEDEIMATFAKKGTSRPLAHLRRGFRD